MIYSSHIPLSVFYTYMYAFKKRYTQFTTAIDKKVHYLVKVKHYIIVQPSANIDTLK